MATEPARGGTARRGRRPRGSDGREQIFDAATTLFGELGYQATTIRRIAEHAGVDTRLVHYYYGSKEDLFGAVIAHAFRSRGLPDLLLESLTGEDGSVGTRYLLAVLTALEDPAIGPSFIGLVRSIGTHEESRRVFLRFVETEIRDRVADRLDADDAVLRVTLAGSQLLGLVMARYVLAIEPLADLSAPELARLVGPTLDGYLGA